MPKETGQRCDRCVEKKREWKENRAAAAAAAEQAAQQSQEEETDDSQHTSPNDSIISGQAIAALHLSE